jgi:hypothetical protein
MQMSSIQRSMSDLSYTCMIDSSRWENDSYRDKVIWIILERPSVIVSGPTQTGTTVTIGCTATGSPAITAIQWVKNGGTFYISGSNGKYTGGSVSTPSLTFTDIAPIDAGAYRCIATNPVGPAISTSAVTLGNVYLLITCTCMLSVI